MSGATEHELLAPEPAAERELLAPEPEPEPEPEPDPRMRRLLRVLDLLRAELHRDPTKAEMLDHMMRRDFVLDQGVRVAVSLWLRRLATRLALEERARELFPEAEVKLS